MSNKLQAKAQNQTEESQRFRERTTASITGRSQLPPVTVLNERLSQLSEHPTARSLRQAHFLELQRLYGNTHAQRSLDRAADADIAPDELGQSTLIRPGIEITPVGGGEHVQRGLWGSIKRGFKKVGRGIKKAAKGAWKGISTAGKAIWTGTKWLGRQTWYKLTGIFYRAIHWVKKLPARLGRLFSHLWQGVKRLKPWSLKWWKSLGDLGTWGDFLKWTGKVAIDLLEAAGIGEVYETIMDILKFNTRPLTSQEIAKAKTVFGSAIDYSLVRVDEAAFIGPSWTNRAYVSFNTINAWGGLDDHTLIHELTHVWQYSRMGAIYMPMALHAQSSGGYHYGGVAELRKRQAAGQGITSFNLEQQGDILADYYIGRTKATLSAVDLATYEYFVKQVRR